LSDVASEIFKKYGALAIIVVFIAACLIWGLAHLAASPGTEVYVLWGLVKYTKPADIRTAIPSNIPASQPQLKEDYLTNKTKQAPILPALAIEVQNGLTAKNYQKAIQSLRSTRSLSDLNCCYWQAIQVLRDSVCLFSKFVRSSSVLNAVYCLTVFISLVLLMRIPAYLLNACSLLMFHAMHTKSHSPFTAAHPRN